MSRSEEAVRREAVARRLSGESPEAIGRSLGRPRQWVARWARRYDPGDRDWAADRSRAPHTVANRTPGELVSQVLSVRERLEANPWAQIGAEAIAWELSKMGVPPPATRTIERILSRAGKVRRRRERYEPKGTPYPTPPAAAPGDLWQADIVGPRHLDGGMPFSALNAIDIAPHAAAIEIVADEREATFTGAVIALMGRLGVPRRLQLDNGKPFVLGGATLGEVVRIALHQGATPVFIPQGEPWRNGVVEHFNDTFDQRFFRSERFIDRTQLAERAAVFERFHNANHRYRATGRRTPDELTASARRQQPVPLAELPGGWPAEGKVEFIRFIRSDRKLRLLRRELTMPEHAVYRYLTATLDLAAPKAENNLTVCDCEGELMAKVRVAAPGGG
ncbi:MAG: integrase core domain-containing protein [Solirubrobacterales bacterium]